MGVNSSRQQNIISDPYDTHYDRKNNGRSNGQHYHGPNGSSNGYRSNHRHDSMVAYHSGSSNNNSYSNNNNYNNGNYNSNNNDDGEYDDECINTIPCLSLFCPPNKSNNRNHHQKRGKHSNEKRRKRKKGSRSRSSNSNGIGTPLPDTPNQIRQRRAAANYGGGLYNGLEVEEKQQQQEGRYQLQEQYRDDRNRNANGYNTGSSSQWSEHHNPYQQNQQHHPSVIYDGADGEKEFMKKYQMCEVLGVGSTSICHRCVNKNTGRSFACKIIDKHQIEQRFAGMLSQFHSEIDALRQLHHPNIIQLYDVFTTKKKIYIVMELMAGGELFDYVVQKGTLTEAEASVIVRMVTGALVYMHRCNIIHRDLKPENLLLKYKPNSIYDLEVKIIDFGLSKSMANKEHMAQSFLGTRGYLAPEMLQRRQYSKSVDTWALGVIVFVLLCGCLPFDDDSSAIMSDEVIRSKFTLRFPRWARNLSPSAKDLLSKLLDVDSSTRYTAEEALRHPWICGTTAPKDSMLHSPGRIMLTPGGSKEKGGQGGGKANSGGGGNGGSGGDGSGGKNNVAAANRTQMNEMIKNRARANSLTRSRARANSNPRQQRQLVRKKSI